MDRWLPELADRRVLRRIDGPLDDTVPAARAITLRDLLTFRLGLGLIFEPSSHWPIQQALNALGVVGFGPPDPASPHGPDEFMRRLGTLPLMHQPGELLDVQHRLVRARRADRACVGTSLRGVPARAPVRSRSACDTGFHVPPAKRDRFASAYGSDASKALVLRDGADGAWSRPPAFADGAAGLVSSADDFLAFARMLQGHGEPGGERALSRASVALMTTNQLTPTQAAGSGFGADSWETLASGRRSTSRGSIEMVLCPPSV